MISKLEELTIYESPDGGKTVYSRKMGEVQRALHSIDKDHANEQRLLNRWANLKELVFMAEQDVTINDMLCKLEMLYEIKKK